MPTTNEQAAHPSAAPATTGSTPPSVVVRSTDGRILNANDFLTLLDGYDPVIANIPAPARPKRRTRYTRAIENLRAAYKAKLDAEAAAAAGADDVAAAAVATAESDDSSTEASASESAATSMTAASASEAAADSTTAAAASSAKPTFKKTTKRKSRARANKGHESPADSIRTEELASELSGFTDAFKARAAADAVMLRALATAYDIALDRAIAAITADVKTPREVLFDNEDEQRVLSWHLQSIAGEFAIATHDSDQSLQHRAGDARVLAADFPAWLTALETGQIDLRHIQAMLRHARQLANEFLPEFGAIVLDFATTHTPSQTGVFAEEAAATIAAGAFEEAHAYARNCRTVTIRHNSFGMSTITAYVPSELATPVVELLVLGAREQRTLDREAEATHMAEIAKARAFGLPEPAPYDKDTRTDGQLRADLFIETLLCAAPGESRVKTVMNVTVPAISLLDVEHATAATGNDANGAADGTAAGAAGPAGPSGFRRDGHGPAVLNGLHPMSIAQARQFAGDASQLQRILTHPITGQVTAVDKYEVSPALRRVLQARDRTCVFPGCGRPAQYCDADHTQPYSEGGNTHVENLAHLCRAHHVQKHQKPWTVTNLGGGVLEWRTPLGQVATTRPKPYGVMFLPEEEYGPPPF